MVLLFNGNMLDVKDNKLKFSFKKYTYKIP
jgi:hypothetical protein